MKMIFGRWWGRNRKIVLILFLFASPFVPLFLTRFELPRLNVYERVQSFFVHPMAEGATNAVDGINVVWERYLALVGTSRENEALKKDNLELKQKILQLEETAREADRLKQLVQLPEREPFQGIAARIIGQDSANESLGFYINVGLDQGVAERMPVVTSEGVVGTIVKSFRNSSVFLGLLDPAHDVDGIVLRSRARMVVEGRGKPLTARLKYLDRSEDVRVGDEILTSGLDGIFPKGLRVGYVIKVDRPRAGVLQEAQLRSAVDLGRIEEVMVLRKASTSVVIPDPKAETGLGPELPPKASTR